MRRIDRIRPFKNPAFLYSAFSGSLAAWDRSRSSAIALTGSGAVRYQAASGARINLMRNPSVETNTTGWAVNAGVTIARVSTWAKSGSWSLESTATSQSLPGILIGYGAGNLARVSSGLTYTASVWVKNQAAGTCEFQARLYGCDLALTQKGDIGGSFVAIPAGGEGIVTVVATIPAGSDGAFLTLVANDSGGNAIQIGVTVWIDPITGIVGTAHASPSVSRAAAWVEEATTNLLKNPSAETNLTDIPATGATGTRDTSYASIGAASAKAVTNNGASSEGLIFDTATGLGYTGSVRTFIGSCMARGSGTVSVFIQFVYTDASVVTGSALNIALTGQWQRIVTPTLASDSAKTLDKIRLHIRTQTQQAATFYVDASQIEEKAYATSYCDGAIGTGVSTGRWGHGCSSPSSGTNFFTTSAPMRVPSCRPRGRTKETWLAPMISVSGALVRPDGWMDWSDLSSSSTVHSPLSAQKSSV